MPDYATLIVLDDGETYGGLEGCSIVQVPDDWEQEQIDDALRGFDGEDQIIRRNLGHIVNIDGKLYLTIE